MKGKRIWLGFTTILWILFQGSTVVYGEQTGNTNVIYVPIATFHELQVIIVGNGCYKDGAVDICTRNQVYQLKEKEEKTLQLYPLQGYQIKEAIFDGNPVSIGESNLINITMKNHNAILILAFEKETKEEVIQKPEIQPDISKEPPSVLTKPNEELKKEIVSIVTKHESVENGDIDAFLKKSMKGNYTILSHNVQNENGTYEVVVQLEDGSIQNIPIVIEEDEPPIGGGTIIKNDCTTHFKMFGITGLFSVYVLINCFRKKIGKENFTKQLSLVTFLYIISLSGIQMFEQSTKYCSIDNKLYIFSCVLAGACTILQAVMNIKHRKTRKLMFYKL